MNGKCSLGGSAVCAPVRRGVSVEHITSTQPLWPVSFGRRRADSNTIKVILSSYHSRITQTLWHQSWQFSAPTHICYNFRNFCTISFSEFLNGSFIETVRFNGIINADDQSALNALNPCTSTKMDTMRWIQADRLGLIINDARYSEERGAALRCGRCQMPRLLSAMWSCTSTLFKVQIVLDLCGVHNVWTHSHEPADNAHVFVFDPLKTGG